MGVRNLLHKPLHFEYALGVFLLVKLLKFYALCRHLRLVKKELAGEKKLTTSFFKRDEDVNKRTAAFLKPFLTSAANHKTLEFTLDDVKFKFLFEVFHLVATLLFSLNRVAVKFWHLSGKLFTHPCHYSHVLAYLVLRFGLAMLLRLPFRYGYNFCLAKKHGFPPKSKLKFLRVFVGCFVKMMLLTTLAASGVTFLLSLSKSDFHLNAFFFLVGLGLLFVSLLPLYHKLVFTLKPLADPELKKEVDVLGKKLGLSHKNVKVFPASEPALSSMTFGFGRNSLLYLNEAHVHAGKHSAVPMLVYLMGHVKNHDFLKHFVLVLLKYVLFVFAYFHFKGDDDLFKSFGVNRVKGHVLKMDAFMFFSYGFFFFFDVAKRCLAHKRMFKANHYALRMGYGDELMNLWLSLFKEKKFAVHADPLFEKLFFDFPGFERKVHKYMAVAPAKAGAS